MARTLREVHDFRGYIHLKLIPDASPELVDEAGLYADRLSVNIELPLDASLDAPGAGEGRRRTSSGPWARCAWASRTHGRPKAEPQGQAAASSPRPASRPR